MAFDEAAVRVDAPRDVRGVLEAVAAVDAALQALGYETRQLPIDDADAWQARLRADIVFNLCESINGDSEGEVAFAATLEQLGVPFTGCSAHTLALARRKDRMNQVLSAAGADVPAWTVTDARRTDLEWQRFPAIVKPAGEDASVGITQASVACDSATLDATIAAARRHAPLLVQRFVEGREMNVGFLGDRVLPVSEIHFAAPRPGLWPIVTFPAKWEPGSEEDRGTTPRCPAALEPELGDRVTRAAHEAWRLACARGYGRVDVRVDDAGDVWILDVNPNPDLAPGAGFARMAFADGLGYASLVNRILQEAVA